jgi:hypothetical protein
VINEMLHFGIPDEKVEAAACIGLARLAVGMCGHGKHHCLYPSLQNYCGENLRDNGLNAMAH